MYVKKLIIAAIAISAVSALPYASKRQVSFRNVAEAARHVKPLDYYCVSDRHDGLIDNGFAVCRQKQAVGYINELPKVGPRSPEWRGIVWIGLIGDGLSDLCSAPNWSGTRIWGNVIAMGDADLLDELEAKLLSD